jgi:hypothetical protein
MTIEQLGSIGELVAAAATIATLGYLAAQIRARASRAIWRRKNDRREMAAMHSTITGPP